jgi:hypothetical protein
LNLHDAILFLETYEFKALLDLLFPEILDHLVFLDSHVFELLVDAVNVIKVGLYAIYGGLYFLVGQNGLDFSEFGQVFSNR